MLKLTAQDDEIYKRFRECFPDLKIDVIDPEDLKSAPAKLVSQVAPIEFSAMESKSCPHCTKQSAKHNKIMLTRRWLSDKLPWANFKELLKQKICLSTKTARLFYTCYWPKCYAIYIDCDWYLAVVHLA